MVRFPSRKAGIALATCAARRYGGSLCLSLRTSARGRYLAAWPFQHFPTVYGDRSSLRHLRAGCLPVAVAPGAGATARTHRLLIEQAFCGILVTMFSYLSHLECSWCHAHYPSDRLYNVCPACGRPLLARYDMEAAKAGFRPEMLAGRPATLWRYAEMLPVKDPAYRITLGEGFTPLLRLERLGAALGLSQLYAKDEGLSPTASFKARGLCLAVARAAELGARALAIPTAGNAGSAMAAYAARAGLPATVYAPRDVPPVFIAEMRALGAEVFLVDGLITDCARYVQEGVAAGRWFDVSTLKEPYRVEGKKTMGYELAEQFGWTLPDVIIYPVSY